MLPKLKMLSLSETLIGDAGCAALVLALDSGALPALENITLNGIPASAEAKRALLATCTHLIMAQQRQQLGVYLGTDMACNHLFIFTASSVSSMPHSP